MLRIGTGGEEGPEVALARTGDGATVFIDGVAHAAALRAEGRAFELSFEDRTERVWLAVEGDVVFVHAFGRAHRLVVSDPAERAARTGDRDDTTVAPTPGTVVSVAVEAGRRVAERDVLMVIESMKMRSELVAWRAGEVERVHRRAGETFDAGAPLVSLASEDEPAWSGSSRGSTRARMPSAPTASTTSRSPRTCAPSCTRRASSAPPARSSACVSAASSPSASASTCCSTPARRSSSSRRWPRCTPTTARRRPRSWSPASGSSTGARLMITAGDSSLKGGSWYPLSATKMIRALQIALRNRLPVINLVDSGGAFLPRGDEIYALGGHIYKTICLLSGAGVPTLALVLGPSTAGGAYLPTLCDQSIMVRGTAFVFLGGPPLVKAATGEEVSAEELGGADMHTSVSGTADYAVDTEQEGLALCREIAGTWPRPVKADADRRAPEAPYYDPQELYGIVPYDIKKQFEIRDALARIVDGSLFTEFKPRYGETLVCGWAFVLGIKVGVLANNGILFTEASNKATQFMQLCDRDGTPLVFFRNITGFMVGRDYERGGITKAGARMLMVQANLSVPKLSVYAHASQGAGNYAMTGPAWDPRFLFAWPNSRSSIMGAEQAITTLTEVRVASLRREEGREPTADELETIRSDVGDYFERTSHPYHLTSELRDDGLIDPVDTRNVLGMALSATLSAPIERTPTGVLRI